MNIGLFQKNKQTGSEPPAPLEFLGFLVYFWKFWTKQGLSPLESPQNCVTPLRNLKA